MYFVPVTTVTLRTLIKYWRWCLGEVVERFDVVTVYKYDL